MRKLRENRLTNQYNVLLRNKSLAIHRNTKTDKYSHRLNKAAFTEIDGEFWMDPCTYSDLIETNHTRIMRFKKR